MEKTGEIAIRKRSHFWLITVLAIVAAAYAVSVVSAARTAFSPDPIYRKESGVYFVCPVRWDSSSLEAISKTAKERMAPMTFFVTLDYCAKRPDAVIGLAGDGNAVGLLAEGAPVSFADELKKGQAVFSALGLELKYAMADEDGDVNALHKAAANCGMTAVMCTFELKNNVTDGTKMVKKVEDDAFSGALIRLEPTKVTAGVFTDMIDTVMSKGLLPQLLDWEEMNT